MENLFLALGDKTRLRLLNLMSGGEICVCFFTEALQEPQPKISRHLAYLRQMKLVETRRDGKWIYYRIAKQSSGNASRVLQAVQTWLENDEQMKLDRERLINISCAPDKMVNISIQRPPKKYTFVKANIESSKETELADFLL